MFNAISQFAATEIVFAKSGGPYFVNGGTPVMLKAGLISANASYQWDLGDGTTANTPTVLYTYGKDGIYIVHLTVIVNQPGGVTSQHYGMIHVRNVPPVVNAGPAKTVNEGEVVPFTGSFTDVQWLETHKATWDWGDSQQPDSGVVSETHDPPSGQGTVTASHAWGDDGTYNVTLSVQDEGGAIGRAQTTVTVLNVPPTVDAGLPMFAYPCSVITLTGKFTDPGWLDKHAGFWDFGDCSGPQRAVIEEQNKPPAGTGVAIASHTYRKCGVYHAVCTVIDDDAGVGTDFTPITVVDILNAGFEDGFCHRQPGVVASAWFPYFDEVPTLANPPKPGPSPMPVSSAGGDIFLSEEFCVHSGQHSQRIRFFGQSRAGVLQKVGANPNWDYQVTVWYSLNEQAGGKSELLKEVDTAADIVPPDLTGGAARLGIDPTGGSDPSSAAIIWAEGYLRPDWSQLSVRASASAKANEITIFLEGFGYGRLGADVFFDDAALLAVQPFCPPEQQPDPPREVCVDFEGVESEQALPPVFVKDDFKFIALDKTPQMVVKYGLPAGQSKLEVHAKGLEIELPFTADRVQVTISSRISTPVVVTAYDAFGTAVDNVSSPPPEIVRDIVVEASGINKITITGPERNLLIRVCARPESTVDHLQQTEIGEQMNANRR
jgi:PKD repeat protein